MGYTLGQAATATGLSKSTLSRAIRSGKLSATRGEDGRFDIDPSELHRVFQPAPPAPVAMAHHDTAALQRENHVLREVVDDLRRRLDQADEERRRLTLILTDQRPRRPWWRWWKP